MLGLVGLALYCVGLFLPLVNYPSISARIGPDPGMIDISGRYVGFWLVNPNVWIVGLGIMLVLLGAVYGLRRDARMGRVLMIVGGLIGLALFGGRVPPSTWGVMDGGSGLWLGLTGSVVIVLGGLLLRDPRR